MCGTLLAWCAQAPFVEDSYQDARYELEDCELEVQKLVDIIERTGLDSALAQDINKYVTVLSHKVNSFKFDQRSKSRSYSSRAKRAAALPPQEEVDKITNMAYLVRLHQRLMIAQLKARACERRWRVLVQECDRCQVRMRCRQFSGVGTALTIMDPLRCYGLPR